MLYFVIWTDDARYAQSKTYVLVYGSETRGTLKGRARLIRNNGNDNVVMDDGNKKDREDRARTHKSKGRCGKHK